MTTPDVYGSISAIVKEVLPDAQVSLFGSRARGNHTNESDWDILILTHKEVNKDLKNKIHEKLFPFSVTIGSFINFILVTHEQWLHDPAYYALRTQLQHE